MEQLVVGGFDCAASLHLVVESGLIGLEERPNVQLSDKEKQELKDLIDRSESLPARYPSGCGQDARASRRGIARETH
jgi:hypothetical protein